MSLLFYLLFFFSFPTSSSFADHITHYTLYSIQSQWKTLNFSTQVTSQIKSNEINKTWCKGTFVYTCFSFILSCSTFVHTRVWSMVNGQWVMFNDSVTSKEAKYKLLPKCEDVSIPLILMDRVAPHPLLHPHFHSHPNLLHCFTVHVVRCK